MISNVLNELLVELILYGIERLPPDVNKRLIEASLKFIHATKRFQIPAATPTPKYMDISPLIAVELS